MYLGLGCDGNKVLYIFNKIRFEIKIQLNKEIICINQFIGNGFLKVCKNEWRA